MIATKRNAGNGLDSVREISDDFERTSEAV